MSKPKIKLDVRKQTLKNKLTLGRTMGNKMSADPEAEVQTIGTNLKNKTLTLRDLVLERKGLQSTVKSITSKINKLEEEWLDIYRASARKIQEKYPDEDPKWLGFGFNLKDVILTKKGRPEKVKNLRASTGEAAGSVNLKWKNFPPGSIRGYFIEINTTDPIDNGAWTNANPRSVGASKATITKLTTGQKYWARVAAYIASGEGTPSNPVSFFAP